MTRNIAVVELDFPTLGKLLNLPAGQFVRRAEYDICRDSLRVLVEGDGLPATPANCPAMTIRPVLEDVTRTEVQWPKEVGNG